MFGLRHSKYKLIQLYTGMAKVADEVSWFRSYPETSLEFFEFADLSIDKIFR